jgi:ATP-binding cassette subfamily C protein
LRFDERIAFEGVSFAYEREGAPVLRDASLSIAPGESVGIVGPTGSGKSTLLDLLLGLLTPSKGRITVDGAELAGQLASWQRSIGYVPQDVYLEDATIRANVAFGLEREEIDDERVGRAVRSAQLDDFLSSLPAGLDTVIGERGVRLSGGERQRVAIARALYHEPELLVFDEATSALDPITELELTRAIDALKGKKTLVVVAHRLGTVRRCDRLFFLRDGRIEAVGSYDELLERSEEFRRMATT